MYRFFFFADWLALSLCVWTAYLIYGIFFSEKKINIFLASFACQKNRRRRWSNKGIINARCDVWRHYKLNRYLTRANIFREHFVCFFFRLQNSHILNVSARVLAFKFRLREMQRVAASAAATHKYLWSNEQKPIAFIYRNFLKIVYMGSRTRMRVFPFDKICAAALVVWVACLCYICFMRFFLLLLFSSSSYTHATMY